MTKIIENYMQIALKNWCNDCSLEYMKEVYFDNFQYIVSFEDIEAEEQWKNSLNSIIMKKSFIEAIARGYEKTKYMNTPEYINVDLITNRQAIAIRDNKLESFITNLWLWTK